MTLDGATIARHRASFGAAAHRYDRVRPHYPTPILDWVVPHRARAALDVGAGTGALTRLLAQRVRSVIGLEPSAAMAARLTAGTPSVPVVRAVGELIPLRSQSIDVVTVAQAWHWLDPERAAAEVHRVLRPTGRIALVWNVRDGHVPWVAALNALLDIGSGPAPTMPATIELGRCFTPTEHRSVAWHRVVDRSAVVELCATRSSVLALPGRRRSALLGEVRRLLDVHPDTAGRTRIALPYRTHAWRADPAPRPT